MGLPHASGLGLLLVELHQGRHAVGFGEVPDGKAVGRHDRPIVGQMGLALSGGSAGGAVLHKVKLRRHVHVIGGSIFPDQLPLGAKGVFVLAFREHADIGASGIISSRPRMMLREQTWHLKSDEGIRLRR